MSHHTSHTTGPGALFLPEGLHYECVHCGQCCRQNWEVALDPAEVESIRALEGGPLRLAGAPDPSGPVSDSPWTPGRPAMRMTAEGTCCMLAGDGLCALHKALGEAAKPNVCRSFPYRMIQTPRGTFAGLSFACTAVLAGRGPAVSGQRAQVEALGRWTVYRRPIESPPDLDVAMPLSWDQYFEIEEDLAALLDTSLGPIGERLLMQHLYLHLLARLAREARRRAGAEAAGPEANREALATLRRHGGGADGEPWAMLRRMARRGEGSALLRRTLLGFIHAMDREHGRRRGRIRTWAGLAGGYVSFALGRGRLMPEGVSRPIHQAELDWIGLDTARPDVDALLTRYFAHRLFRKDLPSSESLQSAIRFQLLHWGLIQWHGAALAADEGADGIGLEHLAGAIRAVEKRHVWHGSLDRFLARMPLVRMLLDRLFEQPRFALSMARAVPAPGDRR